MMQIIAVALGGALGSLLRYLASSGVYLWLGRGFPYGTLTVNIVGSFLMGLMTEALILQRVPLTLEFRTAILVGVFGGFTTFSSFSLETFYLLEQGQIGKAGLNIASSVMGCLLAVWLGLLVGRGLFSINQGVVYWFEWPFPYALALVNLIGALLIGFLLTILSQKTQLAIEHQVMLVSLLVGAFLTLSGLYLVLYLLESGYAFDRHLPAMLTVFISNLVLCSLGLYLGLWLGKRW